LWRQGVIQGRQRLPGEFDDLIWRHAEVIGRARRSRVAPAIIEVPAFHGFQTVAAMRRHGTKQAIGFRS
jgi:hypothetical protein